MAKWYNDKQEFLEVLKYNGLILKDASDEFKNDKDIVMRACKQNGNALKFASDKLKNDKDIVMTAIKEDSYSLQYASNDLRNDKEVVFAAYNKGKKSLQFAGDDIKNNFDAMLELIEVGLQEEKGINSYVLQFASDELKDNYDFVLKSVKADGHSLYFASERLRNNNEIVFEACNCKNVDMNNELASYKYAERIFKGRAGKEIKNSEFGKDLLNAIENDTLNTFKEDYSKYFNSILNRLSDNSTDLNACLHNILREDLEDVNVVNALVNRFSQYEVSRDFNLDGFKKHPSALLNTMKTFNFKEESLINDIKIEIDK